MIQPIQHYVLLGAPQQETQTAGGIILSEARQKRQATVEAIGEDVTAVKVGDQVIYRPYAGDQIKHEDKKYLIVHEKELKAIVNTN